MKLHTTRRWSDDDKHFGPFTFSTTGYRPIGIVLDSGDDDGNPGCCVRLYAHWFVLICELPPVLLPYREKVNAQYWDAATIERMGRDWYYDTSPREYGFTYSEGFLNTHFGRQTGDSSTCRSKGYLLPWTQWRYICRRWYGLSGELVAEHYRAKKIDGLKELRDEETIEKDVPKVAFLFADYDGEEIIATTMVEEMEWHFGTGWFKWLAWFRKKKIQRALDIQFSAETGKRKGSWKGGTVGHSIEMAAGELHEEAFRRYCVEHEMTYIGHPERGK